MDIGIFFLVAVIVINAMLVKWIYVLRQYFHLKEMLLGVTTVVLWLFFDVLWLMEYYGYITNTLYNISFILVFIIIIGSSTVNGLIKTMLESKIENAELVSDLKETRRAMLYMGGALLVKILCEFLG